MPINVDRSRDDLILPFGKVTLKDRYLLSTESFQDMFVRVSTAYADNEAHAQRLYDAMSQLWFMPATPILSNGGTTRGFPISCFLNSVKDSLDGIVETWNENVWLASNGGGIGTYWGNVRSIGEKVRNAGETSGIIPFIHVMDSVTLAISQGNIRRGSAACYLDISHPEVEEFLEIRKSSGDFNRKGLNLHHGICITDEFMHAVEGNTTFALRSPATKQVIKQVDARLLWQRVLEVRLATGEPYLLFIDTANKHLSPNQKDLGISLKSSNLCTEILLPVGVDHKGNDRTAVCCLASLNLDTWDQWHDNEGFIEDVTRMLDNVLTDFVNCAPETMAKAAYAVKRERPIGLGVMGFHSFLQNKGIPFESALAKSWNLRFFRKIRAAADRASEVLGRERGPCEDAAECGRLDRFSHKLAVAPTASISIICGGASACIEPIPANVYNHKTLSGSFVVKNAALERLLDSKGLNTQDTWQSIIEYEGSVQHLSELTEFEKAIFKTAFEIDQRWIVDFAADRASFICQGQSINLYLLADASKWDIHMLHWTAWERGVKSLYYCRSKSIRRAAFTGTLTVSEPKNYAECVACE